MSWYSAHIVMRVRYREGPQEPIYLMENIVILDAATPDDAKAAAARRGLADQNEGDPSFTCDRRPAYWAYAGVRQITTCQDDGEGPRAGTEVTYLEYRVANEEDLGQLLQGQDVWVEFGG